MPTYKKYNFYNLMDTLEEAVKSGEVEQYLNFEGDIHKLELEYNPGQDEFSIVLNNVEIGSEFTYDEAYSMIRSCITSDDEAL